MFCSFDLYFQTHFKILNYIYPKFTFDKVYNSMNAKLWLRAIIVALAGFLFGFDTVVISGAENALQNLWQTSDIFHGNVVVASALWGTVIGALFGNIPTDKIGRKKTLIIIGVLYTVSAIGSGLANDPWMFAFFRFIGGLGVGASTIAAPAYITEIAPAKDRGKLVASYQFNIVFGILIAFVSNYLLRDAQPEPWRWMVGIEALPAIIYTLAAFTISESPRWLMMHKGDETGARKILTDLVGKVEAEININMMKGETLVKSKIENIFTKKYRFPLMLAFLIAFFNQFSGINAFLYYSKRIFEEAGLTESSALMSSVGVGVVNLIFTFVGLSLIDKLGRKQLMYIGSVGYIISLSLVAYFFGIGYTGTAIPIFFFLFIASHAIGQGTVIWVFISEIFPTHLRADGSAFGCGTHWVLAAAIPAMVPFLFKTIGATTVFAIFAIMMVFQLIFVWKMMPETKGVNLEELQKQLTKSN
jgi:sugar porter (SP) family MFS transporter